jgi:hypothetical protein
VSVPPIVRRRRAAPSPRSTAQPLTCAFLVFDPTVSADALVESLERAGLVSETVLTADSLTRCGSCRCEAPEFWRPLRLGRSPGPRNRSSSRRQCGDGALPLTSSHRTSPAPAPSTEAPIRLSFRPFEHLPSPRGLGANLGANSHHVQAASGHDQPQSPQLNGSSSHTRRHAAIVRRCLLSSWSFVRILSAAACASVKAWTRLAGVAC